MKSIVRLSVLLVVVLSLSVSVTMVQGARAGRGGMGTMPALEQNPLTQQQKQQIMQIRQQTQQQVRDVRMNQNLSQQQKQQKISQIQAQGHERVMNVLTPEQKAEFGGWWQQRQSCSGGTCQMKPSGAGAGPGMGRQGRGMNRMGMIPGLQQHPLSEQQRQQIVEIRQDAQNRMSTITNNTSLTQDQKWQQLDQVQRESHDAIVSVLTPEQREELSNWWSSHPASGMGSKGGGMGSGMGNQ